MTREKKISMQDDILLKVLSNILLELDTESAHIKADELIIKVLKDEGYAKLAKAYEQASEEFWYA